MGSSHVSVLAILFLLSECCVPGALKHTLGGLASLRLIPHYHRWYICEMTLNGQTGEKWVETRIVLDYMNKRMAESRDDNCWCPRGQICRTGDSAIR
ncbi:hypothetical protein GGR58DRAFT_482620 [Xylaria digitata]|nr:hypothetical protein GGR58DRAFT_482620 [Xylaria digitata]